MPSPLVLRRAETANENYVLGTLTYGDQKWFTIENRTIKKPGDCVSVREGTYTLKMDHKNQGEPIECLRFYHPGMRTLLIHRAKDNNYHHLSGCIAPGMSVNAKGIQDSEKAMAELLKALGEFHQGRHFQIVVENNAPGVQGDKDEWLKGRVAKGYW
jgi:hypothetical protein